LALAHPFFLLADFEEVLVGVLASRVIGVHIELLLLVYRLLYIPEHVRRESSEDL
jgi:hypothetical protein